MSRCLMVMISLLSGAHIYAMSTDHEDRIKWRVAIVKYIKPTNNLCCLALREKARESFVVREELPIVQLICFKLPNRQILSQIKNMNDVNNKRRKLCQVSRKIIYCPLSMLKDGKEGNRIQLGPKFVICDQQAIDNVTFQEKITLFNALK